MQIYVVHSAVKALFLCFCLKGACVFEQEQGDIVYVPDMWGHAVLNLEDHTVCVAAEFA